MYDKTLVKKKRKKKTVTIITIVAAILVIALCVVAFLSNYVGNFTISIVDYQSRMAISNLPNSGYDPTGGTASSEVTSEQQANEEFTTYTTAPSFTNASPTGNTEVSYYEDQFDVDATMNEDGTTTNYHPSKVKYANTEATIFYAYTFYVTNVGKSSFYYGYGISLNSTSSDTTVLDCLRIRIYENIYSYSGEQTHSYMDYTKDNTGYSTEGMTNKQQAIAATYVATCEQQKTDGTLVYFNSGTDIIDSATSQSKPTVLSQGEVLRYTIVMWMAGDDPDCQNDFDSENYPSSRLSAYVAAYDDATDTSSVTA